MIKTMQKTTKAQTSDRKLEAPVLLNPDQIAQIAAGTVFTAGQTIRAGGIPVSPFKPAQ